MRTHISLLLLLSSGLAVGQVSSERLDEQVRAYATEGRFNGSVLVAKDGKPLLAKGYGMANFEWNIPNAPDTKFRLGSITKQFTAMAILMLQEEGKLNVQDPVCKHVPECPDAWKPVTIHHVLSHTSGIPNFTSFPDYVRTMVLPSPPPETVKRFRDKPLDFEPGSKWAYSNSGYVLLGYILERVAGVPYATFVQLRIFGPLGMKDSGYDDSGAILPGRAGGYERAGALRNASFIDMTIPHAAGALYSTVLDLMKWDEALKARKLLKPESHALYFTPVKNDYAYGWNVAQRGGMTVISHGGGINGFSTSIMRVPDKNLLVVALSNVIPSQAGRIAGELLNLAAGQEVPKPGIPKEIKLPLDVLKRYVGEYELFPGFVLTVTLEGDQLMTQATGQQKLPVFPKSETEFFLKVVEAEIAFEKDAAGTVTGLVLNQGGKKIPGKRR